MPNKNAAIKRNAVFFVSKHWVILFILCLFPASGQIFASKLLFKSGFEDGVALGELYNDGGGTWYQKLLGGDVAGYSWPIEIWNGQGAFQVLVDSSVNSEEYIHNEIITMEGHDGTPSKVMHCKIFKADKEWTQDPYIVEDAVENGDLYVKYWLKFPDNLPDKLGDGTKDDGWCTFFEWKTSGDYRIAAYVYVEKDGKPYWYAHGDNVAKDNYGPYKEFWYEENKQIPVPENEWFLVEFFFHRSTGGDGRFWWAVNKNVIVDHHGPNKIEKHINRLMLFTVYAGQYPFEQWVDDIEIRDGFDDFPPTVTNPIANLDILKNSKETNIDLNEVFTDRDNDTITKKIAGNNNSALITASITGDTLNLQYTPDKTGSAQIVVSGTSNGMTVFDSFTVNVSDEKITVGSKCVVKSSEIPGFNGPFIQTPGITAQFIDPVKMREKEIKMKSLMKIKSSNPVDSFEFQWSKKVALYNKKSLSAFNKQGGSTDEWLNQNPIEKLKCELFVDTVNSNYDHVESKFRLSLLAPPEITSISTDDGTNPENGISRDCTLTIKGAFFGEKLPKVSLEYKNPKGKIKFYKLKVLHQFQYANAKGLSRKSCMDPITGVSQISVTIPKNVPPGTYPLVLNNKTGIAIDAKIKKLPILKIK